MKKKSSAHPADAVAQHLGRLEKVNLRKVWTSEPGGFTPWLAREENLSLLADTINLDLELEAQEKEIGPFRADIVCRETANRTVVLVENQLERTDHTHLGQLMTYAAGLDAVTVVWIAERFTEEHRAALDWLNEITRPEVNFFGLEIELFRIGASPVAPNFNVVSRPNVTTKGGDRGGEAQITATKVLQREYWSALAKLIVDEKGRVKPQAPPLGHWTNFATGRSNFPLVAWVNGPKQRIGVHLAILGPDAKSHFHRLLNHRPEIEREFGGPLDWREKPGLIESQIGLVSEGADFTDRSKWAEQHRWFAKNLEGLHSVFSRRVKELPKAYPQEGPETEASE